jgi:arylsulfatase A-like enzyme
MTCHLPYNIPKSFFRGVSLKNLRKIYPLDKQFFLQDLHLLKKTGIINGKNKELVSIIKKGYLSSLGFLDYQLAKIFYYLQKNKILENSFVVITSDHGENIFDKDLSVNHNSLYNPNIKVPLIVSKPSLGRKKIDNYVQHLDILPTILDELGLATPKQAKGKNLFKNEKRKIISEIIYEKYRHTKHKKCIIENEYKLIVSNDKSVELYNIKKDRREKHNIAKKYPEIVKKLKKELEEATKTKKKPESKKLNKNEEQIMKKRLKSLGYI